MTWKKSDLRAIEKAIKTGPSILFAGRANTEEILKAARGRKKKRQKG